MKTANNFYFLGRRHEPGNPYNITKPITALIAFVIIISCTLKAQTISEAKNLNLEKGVALSGYDPVVYFTLNKAVGGSSDIKYTFNGATYYFATKADKQLFIKAPDKYQPQYGGWCAYAMATKGEKVEIDPGTFKIVNGKLLLFYNRFFNNTLTSWNKNEKNFLQQADANWIKIVKK